MIKLINHFPLMITRVGQGFLPARLFFDMSFTLPLFVGFKTNVARHSDDEFRDVPDLVLRRLSRYSIEDLVSKLFREGTLVPLKEFDQAALKAPILFPSDCRFRVEPDK